MDWGTGQYERTAHEIEPAAEVALEALSWAPPPELLDIGCGTGNAAIAAARRGAAIVGLDPSERLVSVARERAAASRLSATFLVGDATALPFAAASFDAAVSVFALIFVDDAEAAVSEVRRVVRPGGRLVMTSWKPSGPIHEAGKLLIEAASTVIPALAERRAPAWGQPDFVRSMFASDETTIDEHRLVFRSASPEVWFDALEAHHPIWLQVGALLGRESDAWRRLRAESVRVARAGNEDPSAFATTSAYYRIAIDFAR